jgi:hypothetical protein
VLRPDGLLLLSSPNRLVYPPGNPHHVYEYEPEELRGALSQHFANIELFRQTAWLAAAILDDSQFAARGEPDTLTSRVIKVSGLEPGRETFTVAAASNAPLPAARPLVAMGETFEVSWWQEQIQEAAEDTEQAFRLRRELETAEKQAKESGRRLLEAETSLAGAIARIEALEEQIAGKAAEIAALLQHGEETWRRVEEQQRVMDETFSSVSWRLTRPLRWFKKFAPR